LCGTTAARLRFQKCSNIAELVSDRGSIDLPERGADIQSPFLPQIFHTAPADGFLNLWIAYEEFSIGVGGAL